MKPPGMSIYTRIYNSLSEEYRLEPEERNEQKKYQRLADVFTPMLKLISSEYSNDIAYDALQVHGGAGFMKDFPIERLYSDARITSIYEGTSQLQVVAAIRGVTSGAFLGVIRDKYEKEVFSPELEYLKPRPYLNDI
jgi:3-(methylthio)propanoyl-CoA dehydrogenase